MAKPRSKRASDPWSRAVDHLRDVQPAVWEPLIARVGPCQLRPRTDRFGTLVRAVIGQQISSKAATAIEAKVHALAGAPHACEGLLTLGESGLRTAGVSANKARTILSLAEAVNAGAIPLESFDDGWTDDAIVKRLTTIKGIGVWTAEMFLIFALNRPDVLPVSDLGVRVALRALIGGDEIPRPNQCLDFAAPWRPYRSVASWYLWRSLDSPAVGA